MGFQIGLSGLVIFVLIFGTIQLFDTPKKPWLILFVSGSVVVSVAATVIGLLMWIWGH